MRVTTDSGEAFEATTINVSEGGCSLRWPGPLPQVGDLVTMKVGEGLLAASARAVVCWNSMGATDDPRSVGIRIVPQGRGARAWRSVVAELARSGARAA